MEFIMPLNNKQIQSLKTRAHSLKPVILLGNKGLTDAVMNEIDLALAHHELIKVKIPTLDKELRVAIVNEIVSQTKAEQVQLLGQIVTLYRKSPDKKK
jgi:RNA-binding protein